MNTAYASFNMMMMTVNWLAALVRQRKGHLRGQLSPHLSLGCQPPHWQAPAVSPLGEKQTFDGTGLPDQVQEHLLGNLQACRGYSTEESKSKAATAAISEQCKTDHILTVSEHASYYSRSAKVSLLLCMEVGDSCGV